eukprot:4280039-Amphidinium_carterae.1
MRIVLIYIIAYPADSRRSSNKLHMIIDVATLEDTDSTHDDGVSASSSQQPFPKLESCYCRAQPLQKQKALTNEKDCTQRFKCVSSLEDITVTHAGLDCEDICINFGLVPCACDDPRLSPFAPHKLPPSSSGPNHGKCTSFKRQLDLSNVMDKTCKRTFEHTFEPAEAAPIRRSEQFRRWNISKLTPVMREESEGCVPSRVMFQRGILNIGFALDEQRVLLNTLKPSKSLNCSEVCCYS